MKVLDVERNLSKSYQPPNRKLIPKCILGVIHDQNMEKELEFDKNSHIVLDWYF